MSRTIAWCWQIVNNVRLQIDRLSKIEFSELITTTNALHQMILKVVEQA